VEPTIPAEPRFLATPPPHLRAEIDGATELGGRLELLGRHTDAFEVFRRVYEKVLGSQPPGKRFHKGEPLANMGWVRYRSGAIEDGAKWTALAFIEDALSRAEELPTILDELSRPAAQNLRSLGASDQDLYDLALAIRAVVSAGELIADPLVLFLRLAIPRQIRVWIERGTPGVRIRVFVSSPGDMPKERRLIAEICRELSLTMPAHVEALLWEGAGSRNPEVQPFPPEITGLGGQAVIDDHIWNRLGGYDVYLGMLWRRIGTPTGVWRSGTEAEFRYAYDRFSRGEIPRKILFYEKGAKPRRLRDAAATAFLGDLHALGLVTRFGNLEDLRRAAFSHLAGVVREAAGSR
jgi:hypothetical protein